MEYWYDPQHTGAMRIIDHKNNCIYGSDPKEPLWQVSFKVLNLEKKTLIVDFKNKKAHHGKKILKTTYCDRNMTLNWEDGNKWRRMKQDPRILLNKMKI